LNKNSCHVVDKNENFLYFPLSIEPERNLEVLTPFFPDQFELVSKIAKSLPVDYKLYVKEHPVSKTKYWHPIKFYKSLIELPNVRLLHPSVKSEEIISKCSLVATYVGTSGIEATFYEKPVIVFGNSTYHNDFSSVCKIQDINELPKIIRKQLKIKPTIKELNNFVKNIKNNCFQYDPDVLLDSHPLGGHLFSNKEIPIQKMEFFLQKHKQVFQNLVNELIAKIGQNEKNE
jgi:capsule polysaccharide modification protein KpsS